MPARQDTQQLTDRRYLSKAQRTEYLGDGGEGYVSIWAAQTKPVAGKEGQGGERWYGGTAGQMMMADREKKSAEASQLVPRRRPGS